MSNEYPKKHIQTLDPKAHRMWKPLARCLVRQARWTKKKNCSLGELLVNTPQPHNSRRSFTRVKEVQKRKIRKEKHQFSFNQTWIGYLAGAQASLPALLLRFRRIGSFRGASERVVHLLNLPSSILPSQQTRNQLGGRWSCIRFFTNLLYESSTVFRLRISSWERSIGQAHPLDQRL